MSAPELRRLVRDATVRALLGDEWRSDQPTEIGGLIGQMFGEIRRGEDPRQTMGKIDGRLQGLGSIDDAMKELNG